MADDLKRAVEDLQSPLCGDCHTLMKWYRSIGVAEMPTEIAHFFQCPNCGRITETRSTLRTSENGGGPQKLSRPAENFVCAA